MNLVSGQVVAGQTISSDLILGTGVNNCIIRNNTFTNNARIRFTGAVDGVIIKDNVAVGNTGDFVSLETNITFVLAQLNYALKNAFITGNTLDGGQVFNGGFGSPYSTKNFVKTIIIYNNTVTGPTGARISGSMIFDYVIDKNTFVYTDTPATGGDFGAININGGNGRITNNKRSGGWGWLARTFGCSVIGDERDAIHYNNTDISKKNYGNIEMRSEVAANFDANGNTGLSSIVKPTNIRAYNNTCGDYTDTFGNYSNACVLVANDSNGAVEVEVGNNLSYNVQTKGYQGHELGGSNTNVGSFNINPAKLYNNKYYATASLAGVSEDINGLLISGSPAINAGFSNGLSVDNRGVSRPQGAGIDIGASEFISNVLPVANISAPGSVTLPQTGVTIDGSGSADADGTIVSYLWNVSGPNTPTQNLTNPAKLILSNLIAGTYNIGLTVTDNSGATTATSKQLVVLPAPNVPPIAVESNIITTLPNNTVQLDATKSTDSDGTIVSYGWAQSLGPNSATITGNGVGKAIASGLVAGIYDIALTVTDNSGANNTVHFKINVNPAPTIESVTTIISTKQVKVIYTDGSSTTIS